MKKISLKLRMPKATVVTFVTTAPRLRGHEKDLSAQAVPGDTTLVKVLKRHCDSPTSRGAQTDLDDDRISRWNQALVGRV